MSYTDKDGYEHRFLPDVSYRPKGGKTVAAKKSVSPSFPKHIRLDGGRLWNRKEGGVPGYSSEDDNFDILQGNGYVVLVSFQHEGEGQAEFWQKRFRTVKDAMEYAEKM